jgi:hypothetical protein
VGLANRIKEGGFKENLFVSTTEKSPARFRRLSLGARVDGEIRIKKLVYVISYTISDSTKVIYSNSPYTASRPCRYRVLGSDGTRNRCKPAITFAELLLCAKKGRLQWNGLMFIRKSPLQKPKLVRQLLQGCNYNLLRYMLLCLNPVFCSNTP